MLAGVDDRCTTQETIALNQDGVRPCSGRRNSGDGASDTTARHKHIARRQQLQPLGVTQSVISAMFTHGTNSFSGVTKLERDKRPQKRDRDETHHAHGNRSTQADDEGFDSQVFQETKSGTQTDAGQSYDQEINSPVFHGAINALPGPAVPHAKGGATGIDPGVTD